MVSEIAKIANWQLDKVLDFNTDIFLQDFLWLFDLSG